MIDFRQYEIIEARAHRERAKAVRALILAPIGRFFARLFAQKQERPQLRSSRWIAAHRGW